MDVAAVQIELERRPGVAVDVLAPNAHCGRLQWLAESNHDL